MLWEIVFHAEFHQWFMEQEDTVQESIAMILDILEEQGVNLGRPYADTLKGTQIPNLKELRVQHAGEPYRILFAFDPERQAVLLLGGNKAGDKYWYKTNIPKAEKRFQDYLNETQGGKLI